MLELPLSPSVCSSFTTTPEAGAIPVAMFLSLTQVCKDFSLQNLSTCFVARRCAADEPAAANYLRSSKPAFRNHASSLADQAARVCCGLLLL